MSVAIKNNFVECSQIEILRANFFISLLELGKTDEEINAAYAGMLPAGGEAELATAYYESIKLKYVPFAGFLLARFTPTDYNIKGTIREYAERYDLDVSVSAYRDVYRRIIRTYGRLNAKGCKGVEIAEWGHQYWNL